MASGFCGFDNLEKPGNLLLDEDKWRWIMSSVVRRLIRYVRP